MMRTRSLRGSTAPVLILAVLVFAAVASLAFTSGPTFWTVATAAEFLRGTSDGVYVSLNGVVSAGPQLSNRLTTTPPQIWSLAEAPDGTLWAGTGGDGRVIRLRAGPAGAERLRRRGDQRLRDRRRGTRVYAATSPDGTRLRDRGHRARAPVLRSAGEVHLGARGR